MSELFIEPTLDQLVLGESARLASQIACNHFYRELDAMGASFPSALLYKLLDQFPRVSDEELQAMVIRHKKMSEFSQSLIPCLAETDLPGDDEVAIELVEDNIEVEPEPEKDCDDDLGYQVEMAELSQQILEGLNKQSHPVSYRELRQSHSVLRNTYKDDQVKVVLGLLVERGHVLALPGNNNKVTYSLSYDG